MSKQKLKIAIVDEELPYPANSGKRLRTLNLLSRLADRHEITYFAHRNQHESEVSPAQAYLRNLGIEPFVISRTVQRRNGFGFYWALGMNLFSPLPYSVTSHTSRQLCETIKQHVSQKQFDLWHCEWTPYAESFRHLPAVTMAVMAHNVESLIWQRYFETETNIPKRWYIKRQWRKFQRFESWAFKQATRTIAVSDQDASLAQLDFGAKQVDVVENGVDTSNFQPAQDQRNPQEMLFLGSLDWRPNLDGLDCFVRDALPKILAAYPSQRLVIVGRNPASWLCELAESHPNIELHANVPDVRPFIKRSGMMVVPLRVGGGSRLKILEAAASGLPVVSTKIGAEGLLFEPERHYLAANSIPELADRVIDARHRLEQLGQLACAAREQVVAIYDWDRLANKLDHVWRDCVAKNAASNN